MNYFHWKMVADWLDFSSLCSFRISCILFNKVASAMTMWVLGEDFRRGLREWNELEPDITIISKYLQARSGLRGIALKSKDSALLWEIHKEHPVCGLHDAIEITDLQLGAYFYFRIPSNPRRSLPFSMPFHFEQFLDFRTNQLISLEDRIKETEAELNSLTEKKDNIEAELDDVMEETTQYRPLKRRRVVL